MKDFNFNTQKFENKQFSFFKWIKISLFLILILLLLLILFQIKQFYNINKLVKEKNIFEQKLINFDNIVKEKNKVKDEKNELLQSFIKLEKKSSNYSKEFTYKLLYEIAQIIPEGLYLYNLEYKKDNIVIKGLAATAQDIVIFVKKLSMLSFIESVKLEYLKIKDIDSEQQLNDQFIHDFLLTLKIKRN